MSESEVEQLVASLPKRIARLGELAYNLWWTWHAEAPKLWQRIDPVLWEAVYHNPVKLLRQVSRQTLTAKYQDSQFVAMYDRVMDDLDRYMATAQNGVKPWFARTYGDWDAPIA